jgi:hypothetical protein
MILKLFSTSPLGEYYIKRFYEQGENIKKQSTIKKSVMVK